MGSNKISQIQLISIGACFSMGSIIITVFESHITTNEAWLSTLLGLVFSLPTLFVFLALTKKYPGMDIFQMCNNAFGFIVGKIVSALYLLYFISICTLSLFDACSFLYYSIMPDTPILAIAVTIIMTCIYCARKGILPIARVSTLFAIVCCVGLLINSAMTFLNANYEFMMPLFRHSLLEYVQSAHTTSAISYGELVFIFMFMPNLSEKANPRKVILWVSGICSALLLLIVVREILTLGPLLSYTSLPSYEAVRISEGANLLSQTESIFALLLVTVTFFKSSILFNICLKGISDLFGTKTYRNYTLMFGALMVVLAVNVSQTTSDHFFVGQNITPFGWSIFSFVLPLLLLIVGAIKSARKRKKERLPA